MNDSALRSLIIGGTVLAAVGPASAEAPLDILQALGAAARRESAGFSGFSAPRGQALFTTTHGEWSCASCHGPDPLRPGQHARTGKVVAPLAPAANPERFTSPAKVDKWFARNCRDVLGRACTPAEQGDVLAWLLSLGR